jgi:TctA family transporter
VVRSSAIGVWFGVLPGVGGGTAQWVAYAHARQTSRDKARFGHGSIEGLIAATAVNNSKEGGSILPTIAFGVPGGASMALLLGAFVVTGLTPGPPMLTTHLDVTFGMVWTIVLANVVVVAVCFAFLKQLAGITMVKSTLLAPFLVVLVGLGAYTATNSWMDLVALLVFGAIGLAAQRWGWPAPPLIIGLVLGDIMERNYFLSYSLFGFAWLGRPLVLALLLATVAGLVWPLLASRGRREASGKAPWRPIEADVAAG